MSIFNQPICLENRAFLSRFGIKSRISVVDSNPSVITEMFESVDPS